MKIYKHKIFLKWAKKELLTDKMIQDAVTEMCNGLIDADLGAGLYKKRIPMPGHGKSGSYRTLLAFQINELAIFVYGFSKKEKDNISQDDKKILKKLAGDLLQMSDLHLVNLLKAGILIEVK